LVKTADKPINLLEKRDTNSLEDLDNCIVLEGNITKKRKKSEKVDF